MAEGGGDDTGWTTNVEVNDGWLEERYGMEPEARGIVSVFEVVFVSVSVFVLGCVCGCCLM